MKTINSIYGRYSDIIQNNIKVEYKLITTLDIILNDINKELCDINAITPFNSDIKKIIDKTKTKANNTNLKYIISLLNKDINHPKYKILVHKFRLLFICYNRWINAKKRYEVYKQMNIPYNSFNILNTTINTEMSKSILRGYSFNLGIGSIKVQRIERHFDDNGQPKDRSINWEESNKFKQTLLDAGIELYDKNTNPNGRKWLLYHTEPYVYYINWFVSVNVHKFIKFFKFEPSTYINTKSRIMNDSTENVDVEDILNNPKLGFRNKLSAILTVNPAHALKYV